jgi:hypothetical protein
VDRVPLVNTSEENGDQDEGRVHYQLTTLVEEMTISSEFVKLIQSLMNVVEVDLGSPTGRWILRGILLESWRKTLQIKATPNRRGQGGSADISTDASKSQKASGGGRIIFQDQMNEFRGEVGECEAARREDCFLMHQKCF